MDGVQTWSGLFREVSERARLPQALNAEEKEYVRSLLLTRCSQISFFTLLLVLARKLYSLKAGVFVLVVCCFPLFCTKARAEYLKLRSCSDQITFVNLTSHAVFLAGEFKLGSSNSEQSVFTSTCSQRKMITRKLYICGCLSSEFVGAHRIVRRILRGR